MYNISVGAVKYLVPNLCNKNRYVLHFSYIYS